MKRFLRSLYIFAAAAALLGTTSCTALLSSGYDYPDYYDSYYYQTGGLYNPGVRPPYGTPAPPPPPVATRPTPPPPPATRPTPPPAPTRPTPATPPSQGHRPGQAVTPSRPTGSGNASNSGTTRPRPTNEPAQNSGRTR